MYTSSHHHHQNQNQILVRAKKVQPSGRQKTEKENRREEEENAGAEKRHKAVDSRSHCIVLLNTDVIFISLSAGGSVRLFDSLENETTLLSFIF